MTFPIETWTKIAEDVDDLKDLSNLSQVCKGFVEFGPGHCGDNGVWWRVALKRFEGSDLYLEPGESSPKTLKKRYSMFMDVGRWEKAADTWRKNLRGAYLEGANLGGASLRGADLEGANLEGANLVNTNLMNAKI